MLEPLTDDVYLRKGISLFWDISQIQGFLKQNKVISLRKFFYMYSTGWKHVGKELNLGKNLLVAGLDSLLDSMQPQILETYLSNILYSAILSFQNNFAGGGDNAALIFWINDKTRIDYQPLMDVLYYHCNLENKGNKIALGKCLFKGAEKDLSEISLPDNTTAGIFQKRIS
jgi:hypothetical protein